MTSHLSLCVAVTTLLGCSQQLPAKQMRAADGGDSTRDLQTDGGRPADSPMRDAGSGPSEVDAGSDRSDASGGGGSCESMLVAGGRLGLGQQLCSPNGAYGFGLGADGDLSLRKGSEVLWTAGAPADAPELVMQSDGNLVVYADRKALWASGTHDHPGAFLTMEDQGRVVVQRDGDVLWCIDCSGLPESACSTCAPGDDDGPKGKISHIGTTQKWDADGQDLQVDRPAGSQEGDLLVLVLHRTDDELPLFVDDWTRVAECYKRDNGYDCSTEADCTVWYNDDFCQTFGDVGQGGRDLAQAVFYRAVSANEPSRYTFDLNRDTSGHPGWAILSALRGAATQDPVRDWSNEGCDGDADSLFPSVYGEAGDLVLLSQAFDDAIAQAKFGAPSGTETFGYVSDSDEAGFLFGGTLAASGDTGVMRTEGDGGPGCKDALVSLTIKPQ